MRNKVKLLFLNYLVICLIVPAIGQDYDECVNEILNNQNDSIFKNASVILKYKESNRWIKILELKEDSLSNIIKKSTLTKEEQGILNGLIKLSVNDISGDVYSKVKELDQALIINFNEYIFLTFIYDLDRKYYKLTTIAKECKSWASKICQFIRSESIDYYNAENIKVEDTVFLSEIKLYKFNTDDVIADIGAGSGYFEKVLSKFCDRLTVFVSDIDSAKLARLTIQLEFLELYDKKNITYSAVFGNEKSSPLPFNSFDKVIIRNTFHHFSHPNEMLEDCKRIMKKDGKLFIVDILIDEVERGPACPLYLSRTAFLNYLQKNGFILINETKLEYDNFKCFEFQLAL